MSDKKIGKCPECKRSNKELVTGSGVCWRCHLGTVTFNTAIEVRKKTK